MKSPNLLLIWTDEQRRDTMACYGNPYIQTPNLNRLGDSSFVFDNAYCCQPICTPSRASILTGVWPHTHGCVTNNTPLPASNPTLAELVSGYYCAYYGKWHLGDEVVAQRGFSEWKSIEDGMYRPYFSKPEYLSLRSDYHHYLVSNGYTPDSTAADGARVFSREAVALLPARHTKAGFLGREAAGFINRQTGDSPWVLSVNFLEPHMPFFGPFNDMYEPAKLEVGPEFAHPPGAEMAEKKRKKAQKFKENGHDGFRLETESDWRRIRANYYGLVSMVDVSVGKILDALDASGQADNTIVVFTSDHGDMMGDHACLAKELTYEASIGIPLLVRVPWMSREQTRVPGNVSQIDLLPTLLDLLDQPLPSHLQGKSLRKNLEGPCDLSDNQVVVEWNNGDAWRTIIHAGWKLNLCASDTNELFDLRNDPHELKNRYLDPSCQATIADLTSRLKIWQQETGDSAAVIPSVKAVVQ